MKNYFRQLAHLYEQIGQDRFEALIDSENTWIVFGYSDRLVNHRRDPLKIEGRMYEMVGFHAENERSLGGEVLMSKAEELGCDLGQEDAEFLLAHQDQIPANFRDYVFIFPASKKFDECWVVEVLGWHSGCKKWVLDLTGLDRGFNRRARFLKAAEAPPAP